MSPSVVAEKLDRVSMFMNSGAAMIVETFLSRSTSGNFKIITQTCSGDKNDEKSVSG